MTIQQLQYVVALDTHRHFVKAADSCFVAQPTLTLQVRKLEDEIGVQIFDRSKKPIQPTALGIDIIAKAREIIVQMDSLKAMISDDKTSIEGSYRLAVIPTLAPYVLPLFLQSFMTEFTQVKFEIFEMQSEHMIQAIKEGKIDIGMIVTPIDDANIREVSLFNEPFVVYTSLGHELHEKLKIKPQDIEKKGLWLLQQGHCFRNQVLNICDKREEEAFENLTFESGSIETLKNMVKNNFGFTLIPELAIDHKNDQEYVRRFVEPQPVREVSLVVHASFTRDAVLEKLRQAIVDSLPDSVQKTGSFVRVKWRS